MAQYAIYDPKDGVIYVEDVDEYDATYYFVRILHCSDIDTVVFLECGELISTVRRNAWYTFNVLTPHIRALISLFFDMTKTSIATVEEYDDLREQYVARITEEYTGPLYKHIPNPDVVERIIAEAFLEKRWLHGLPPAPPCPVEKRIEDDDDDEPKIVITAWVRELFEIFYHIPCKDPGVDGWECLFDGPYVRLNVEH